MIILRQKEYAKRDYEGLNEGQAFMKRQERSKLAKELLKARKSQDSQAKKVMSALSTSGRKTYTGGYIDLSGKQHDVATMGFDKPLDFKKVKELQKGDRMIQNAELLRESDIRKREINDKFKRKDNPFNKTKTNTPNTKQKEATEGFIKRNWNKLGKGGKIAVGTGLAATTALGTGLAIKKHNDKKKKEQE